MALIQFVQNYEDLCTDRGFQFKFHCDKCGNGYMTRFQASTLGMAESVLEIAGNVFGGIFKTVGNSAYQVQRAVGGKAHDMALEEAVREGKDYFRQCTRCGRWVCPDVCWNAEASLCEGCAPKLEEELAASHAQAKAEAARAQLREKASKVDYTAGVDMSAKAVLSATPGAQASRAATCTGCGAALSAGARFCPACGAAVARAPSACGACGSAIAPNMRFCAQCGAKVGDAPG